MTTRGKSSNRRGLNWYVDTPPIRRWIAAAEARGEGDAAWERVSLWDKMVEQHGVVNVSTDGRVAVVELCYPPKANAQVPPMYRLFSEAVNRLAADDEIWVIVITGAGKNFSSGGYVGPDAFYAGLDAGEDGAKGEPIRRTFSEMFLEIPKAIAACEKPTIAAINGAVMAESLDIALTADLRTGSPDTQFRFSFAATGNTAYTGAAWSLPRLIGLSRAKQYLLGGEWVGGEQAFAAGLLNYLYETDKLLDETKALANRIAGFPPITQRLIKKELQLGDAISEFGVALDLYSMIEPIVQSTEDHMDAERAILEKRPPVVRGQ